MFKEYINTMGLMRKILLQLNKKRGNIFGFFVKAFVDMIRK